MKNCIKSFLAFLFLTLWSIPVFSFASEIKITSTTVSFNSGDEFIAQVFLDTQGESINAIEGKLVFPDRLLDVREIRSGNSIVSFWLDAPTKINSGEISFSGVIPGGYQGQSGYLFSIVFKAKGSGNSQIELSDIKLLKNDGNGTISTTKITPFNFSILKSLSSAPSPILILKDKVSPEEFKAEVGKTNDLFDGKYFLAFATQDKGSGIDHYEVKEGFWDSYTLATSPYLLKNQNVDKKIYIKAIDKDDNDKTEVVYPPNWKPWYKNYALVILIIVGILLIARFVDKK